MKKIYTLALAALVLTAAKAQDVTLTVAAGTNQVKVTLPAGEYTVNDANVTSDGNEMAIALNGATEVAFRKADGSKMTAFAAVNQPAIIGMKGSGSGIVSLDLHGNNISSFNFSPSISNGVIKTLLLNDNALSSLTFSGGRWNALEVLDVSNNSLSSLALTSLSALKQLYCSNNKISGTLTGGSNLNVLWCDNNKLKSLKLTACNNLESLVAGNNEIASISTPSSGLPKAIDLWLDNNLLETAALSGSTVLSTVNVANNKLKAIELSATDKKIFFADFSGNQLMFDKLYSTGDITNYIYGNQQRFSFAQPTYKHGQSILMPDMSSTNLSGDKITMSTSWYNWENDSELERGTATNSSGDFVRVSANKEYYFKPNFIGIAYATISSSKMPNLVLRSHGIRIVAEDDFDGVDKLQAAGFTFNVMPGALQMSSQEPIKVRVADLSGRIVWNGTVDSHGVQVDNLNGTYVVNGVKVNI